MFSGKANPSQEYVELRTKIRSCVLKLSPNISEENLREESKAHLTVGTSFGQKSSQDELRNMIGDRVNGLCVRIPVTEILYLTRTGDTPFRVHCRFPLNVVGELGKIPEPLEPSQPWVHYDCDQFEDGKVFSWPSFAVGDSSERSYDLPKKLKVVSWNVLHGVGFKSLPSDRYKKQMAFIKSMNADILLLQEATAEFLESLWAEMEEEGWFVSHRPMDSCFNHGDNVVLSRFPFTANQWSISGHGAKFCLIADFEGADNTTVSIVNVHLTSDYRGENTSLREKQLELIYQVTDVHENLLIGGDFNEVNEGVDIHAVDAWSWLKSTNPKLSMGAGLTFGSLYFRA